MNSQRSDIMYSFDILSFDSMQNFENLSSNTMQNLNFENLSSDTMWKLNPGVRTITLTKIIDYTCKLHTKETEYGVEH